MDLGLSGRVALIAGASAGLGFATAQQLLAEGASVMICGRDAVRLDSALAQLDSAHAAAQVTDVTDRAAIEALVAATVARFGRLDLLVTNAGGPPGGTFDTTSAEQWEAGIELTLMSAVHLIQAALPHLRQSDAASILTITSMSAKQPVDNLLLSNAIRPAVLGLTKSLSIELGPENIRVNSILPGWTRTERVDYLLNLRAEKNAVPVEEVVASIHDTIPLRRMATPAEFARTATFLLSPAASYITGVMLQVDGGRNTALI